MGLSDNKFMRILVFVLLAFFSFLIFTKSIEAKVLPQAKKSGKTAVVKSSGSTIGVSPRMRGDRRALIVNFSNLQNASSVSYFLTYKQSGQQEGARGTLNLSGGFSQSAELLFGTCSKQVCRYHSGIKDAKLEVNYTSKSGKKYLKRYRIRV